MARANKTEIRCPCRDCKLMFLIKPDSGLLESHLLRRDFMDDYTRWICDAEDGDEEDVNNGEDMDAGGGGAGDDDHEDDHQGGAGHGHEIGRAHV